MVVYIDQVSLLPAPLRHGFKLFSCQAGRKQVLVSLAQPNHLPRSLEAGLVPHRRSRTYTITKQLGEFGCMSRKIWWYSYLHS